MATWLMCETPLEAASFGARQHTDDDDQTSLSAELSEHSEKCRNMGNVYVKMGRLSEAIEMLHQHLIIAQRSAPPTFVALTFHFTFIHVP